MAGRRPGPWGRRREGPDGEGGDGPEGEHQADRGHAVRELVDEHGQRDERDEVADVGDPFGEPDSAKLGSLEDPEDPGSVLERVLPHGFDYRVARTRSGSLQVERAPWTELRR